MEALLNKIFNENQYELKTHEGNYYSNKDKSYFFSITISEAELKSLKSKQHINDNQKYKAALESFKNLVNSGEHAVIEKNSSLIVMVQCTNISALSELQQQILLLEEDEYFFKKYVIIYTPESIVNLNSSPIIPELRQKINLLEDFKKFASSGYVSDLSEYLLITQLFIKLPFLTLEYSTNGFTPLNQKLSTALSDFDAFYNVLLQRATDFSEIDFTDLSHEDKINELMNILPND